MKLSLLKTVAFVVTLGWFAPSLKAQTAGNLTFNFTEVSKSNSATYGNQGRHVMAVWIQTSTGTFIKTMMRYGGQNSTSDHLPIWAGVSSNGASSNCISSSCNTVGASTGATLSSWSAKSITWNGKDASGNLVADGSYQVGIEECWAHGTSGKTVRYFSFTKGTSADNQTPTSDANFSNISLAWSPSSAGLEETKSVASVKIYPNPSTGIIHVDYEKATDLKVVNVLGVTVAEEKLEGTKGTKNIDLSNYNNGVYFCIVSDGTKKSTYKIVLNK